MANSSQNFSSKRHFHWTKKVGSEGEEVKIFNLSSTSEEEKKENVKVPVLDPLALALRRKLQAISVSKFWSVLAAFDKKRSHPPLGLGHRVIGTLFGYRGGHVHIAFQREPNSFPAFLIELATPISSLVREMASGLVRIALECEKEEEEKKERKLVEEPRWRTYCNGKKCGFATRRECGPKEWKVLRAVELISMGAGVLPPGNVSDGGESDGEVMYMRAKFERVVGSRDSEAFYMMNPDSNGAPELSIYLLRS